MEDFVTYEQAKKLREVGFGEETRCGYYKMPNGTPQMTKWDICLESSLDYPSLVYYKAPTLAQAQKWLREKEIEVAVYSEFDGEIRTGQWVWLMRKFTTHLFDTTFSGDENLNYDTYEEALSAVIDKAIELLKANGNGK